MKIGIDIHGVIDTDPKFFKDLTVALENSGNEVHILTGVEDGEEVRKQLTEWGVRYTKFFSITSHHKSIGTLMKFINGNPRRPLIASNKWDRTKADYCEEHNINIMIDDSFMYEMYFDKIYTQYIRWDSAMITFLSAILNLNK